jgi:hypothetical protein
LSKADVVIAPSMSNVGQLGLADRHWVFQAGYRAATGKLDDIEKLK